MANQTCKHCGRGIYSTWGDVRDDGYCSDQCKIDHTRAEHGAGTKRCLHCGQEFTYVRKSAKFCCTQCRVQYNRNLKAARDQAAALRARVIERDDFQRVAELSPVAAALILQIADGYGGVRESDAIAAITAALAVVDGAGLGELSGWRCCECGAFSLENQTVCAYCENIGTYHAVTVDAGAFGVKGWAL